MPVLEAGCSLLLKVSDNKRARESIYPFSVSSSLQELALNWLAGWPMCSSPLVSWLIVVVVSVTVGSLEQARSVHFFGSAHSSRWNTSISYSGGPYFEPTLYECDFVSVPRGIAGGEGTSAARERERETCIQTRGFHCGPSLLLRNTHATDQPRSRIFLLEAVI